MHVLIVGAGMGGLSAARALSLHGIDVDVYERADALGEVGAGIQITPNGQRQLDRIGVGDAVRTVGSPMGKGSTYFRADGSVVGPVIATDEHGAPCLLGVHRADLVDLLADSLSRDTIHTGCRVVGVSQDDRSATITMSDGSSVAGDAVVVAEGIHPTLQKQLASGFTEPVHSGSVAYRGLLPSSEMPHWPTDRLLLWMGDKKHFLVYPLRAGTLLNFVGFVPVDNAIAESWTAPGDPDELRREFAGWDSEVEHLLSHVTETFRSGLYDREPLTGWTKGRFTLLGDAAHPMLPHLGQGVNQSIEDGVAIAAALSQVTISDVPQALERYEKVRRERTALVQRRARENGRRYDSMYAELSVRDAEIQSAANLRSWLYKYDVLHEPELNTSSDVNVSERSGI